MCNGRVDFTDCSDHVLVMEGMRLVSLGRAATGSRISQALSDFLVPRRIEFVVTHLCNGQCIHCYAEKQKDGFPKHADLARLADVVKKVVKKFSVDSVMTFGGEPMLFPDVVCSIHTAASETGILRRQVITNGYWSDSSRDVSEMARRLAESGVNQVLVSVDAFHQQFIPLEQAKLAVTSCIDAGIEDVALNPCWVVSKEDNNVHDRRTRAILAELEHYGARVSKGNLLEPAGLALTYLTEFLPQRNTMPKGRCGDIEYTEPLDHAFSISVEPDGEVVVCSDFHIGNIYPTDILDIINSYNPYSIPEMSAIVEEGLAGLLRWAQSKGVSPDPLGYYTMCHMCRDLRKRAQRLQSISERDG